MIRTAFIIVFALLIVTLLICGFVSVRSDKPIGKQVHFFCLSLIPPVLGNMIIIGATTRSAALVGCYIYYIGMDFIMYTLINFTNEYCRIKSEHGKGRESVPSWMKYILLVDIVQMLLNIFTGHAFSLQEIEAYGKPYFIMNPLLGQTFHRIVCYGVMLIVLIVFVARTIKAHRLYKERYIVILLSMILGTMWQTFYIFSRTPIDRSMVGFAVVGILIFYFSIYYRPLRLLDKMLADIVSDTRVAVFLYGPEGRCIWVNHPAKELTKTRGEDYESMSHALMQLFGPVNNLPESVETEFTNGPLGNVRHYLVARGYFRDDLDRKLGTYIRVRDITEEKNRIENELFATNHDAVTGLYNKEYTFKKISDQLQKQALKDYYVAVINIFDFKMFNDVYGRAFGDAALIQVADWLRKYSDDKCIYGRLSGDTFGSCLPKNMFFQDIVEEDLSKFTVKLGDTEQHLMIHIGFCEIEDDDTDVDVLYDRAVLALDSIRDNYKKHVAFFDKSIRDKMIWKQELSSQLGIAIEQDQVVPYLQPIVDKSGRIVGAEALARWIHPEHGFMSPADFIPLFEENGMIVDLDKHIWKSACRILSDWEKKYPNLFISVNVSPKDFYVTDVLSDITGMVAEYSIDPNRLRIEVTESSMMRDTDDKMKVLDDFRQKGFIVEMDDFGSGYSSLNMLKDMPVDVLKIDMKFLGKGNDEKRADIVVKNVIKLSEDLGIISLTEGVETLEQFDTLNELGCNLFQGYYFSKPVPVTEFEALLAKQ